MKRGSIFVSILVAVLIIGTILLLIFGPKRAMITNVPIDPASKKETTAGQAIDKASAVDCQNRLRQIRLAIEMYKSSNDGKLPRNISALDMGTSGDYTKCPVSESAYIYNPETGTVMCTTHTDH